MVVLYIKGVIQQFLVLFSSDPRFQMEAAYNCRAVPAGIRAGPRLPGCPSLESARGNRLAVTVLTMWVFANAPPHAAALLLYLPGPWHCSPAPPTRPPDTG